MSNRVLAACRKLQMPPTAKAVLVCLADYADDSGACWPSIDTIAEFTCFGRTAVIGAIRFLETTGVIKADRSNGRHTAYVVDPEAFNQSASRTGAPAEPVRLPNQTSTAPVLHQSVSRTAPVRQADSNHQEPPRTTKRATTKKGACAPSRPDGVTEQTWADWLALRNAKRAPVTATVLKSATSEAAKAGMTLERFLGIWCARGSQGLQADWLKPNERMPQGPPAAQPVGKQMQGLMALEARKRELANRMAGNGNLDGPAKAGLPFLGSDPGG